MIHNRSLMKKTQYLLNRLRTYKPNIRSNAPKIFANSIPKAGTNLLSHTLGLFPFIDEKLTFHYDQNYSHYSKELEYIQHGQIVTAHLKYTYELSEFLSRRGFKCFFIYRDPRDIVISNAFYITYKDNSHRLHDYFKNTLKSDKQRILASIQGIKASTLNQEENSLSISDHLKGFLPWLNCPNCLSIKFEDLIGDSGGGDSKTQMDLIRHIEDFLGISNISTDYISAISENVFSKKSKTFRKGVIGDWKVHFDDEIKEIFKEECGRELIKLGYETNYDW